ncbi:MAG: DNRLRE domain-containing protein [Firmicutes bacterium]|nr:DNRLRE domain-containing protein [Bacillota bacterium]
MVPNTAACRFITEEYRAGDFKLVSRKKAAAIFVEPTDYPGVKRAVHDLQEDIRRVTGQTPEILDTLQGCGEEYLVIIGTLGKSGIIEELIAQGKVDAGSIRDKWEAHVIQVVAEPVPGVGCGLVIAGSDQRGTIYGIYNVSEQIGVSPWYWWADVTPEQKETLVVKEGLYRQGEPSVKYRGIFLNNEAPSLTSWVQGRYGGFNSFFYEDLFELILRLKGNYLWPAMWSPKSFFRDDPFNLVKAKEYGIVIGTSHREPMMRSWGEWRRYGEGEWNFQTNAEVIKEFWADGIELAKDYEKIVTIGMRGDGDEPLMADGTMEEKIAILERIITEQRKILAEKIDPDLTRVPQLWALYKEVQQYYEAGMRVPDDVTILFADDNFGNIRMLPKPEERDRPGGYGMYYHFDYVGGPRSYRWVSSVPLPKIWQQMRMTYDYGVDRIWIVNVGCLKAHEVTTEFFLDMAYDINKWNKDNLTNFARQWAEREFGPEYAVEIAGVVMKYMKFNSRRKPEIIAPNTYSLLNYREAERVLAEFSELVFKAEEIYEALPAAKKDAYYQLVLYPVRGSMNVLKLNIYAGLNNFYARQRRTKANVYADLTEYIFAEEAADTFYYNNKLAQGKWKGIMSDPHIGQTGWKTPEQNIMPEIKRLVVEAGSAMGVAVEGSLHVRTKDDFLGRLPGFSVFTREKHYIDIFNLKRDPFRVVLTTSHPWIKLSIYEAFVEDQIRAWVDIDWERAPKGRKINGRIKITGTGIEAVVKVVVHNPESPTSDELEDRTFVQSNGCIIIEAEHYAKNVAVGDTGWQKVPDYGRALSSMVVLRAGAHPGTGRSATPPENSPYLEYRVYIENPGDVKVIAYTAPTLNVIRDRGLRYAVSFDDQPPQIVDTFPKEFDADDTCRAWEFGVMYNIRVSTTHHTLKEPGYHTLRFWMVDPEVVLERIILDIKGIEYSYLGPPESFYKGKKGEPSKDGYLDLLATFDYGRYLKDVTETGRNHGQTTEEAKEKLASGILMAKEVLKNSRATLEERLGALAGVNRAIKIFQSSLVYKEGYRELEAIVARAEAVLADVRIGCRHGEYPPEAKETLEKAIAAARELLVAEGAVLKDRQEMVKRLDREIEKFWNSVIVNLKHKTLYPTEDTFVRDGEYAGLKLGGLPRLEVKLDKEQPGTNRFTFLRFDLGGLPPLEKAVLRLYAEHADNLRTRELSLYDITDLDWPGDHTTWETAPLSGGDFVTGFSVTNKSGVWYEIDVTDIVKKRMEKGEISFRLQVDTSHWASAVFFTSKEGERNPPELSLVVV